MKKIKLEPQSVDDHTPDVNSSAAFVETKTRKFGRKKRKPICPIKNKLSDVNEEQDDLDSTNNMPTQVRKSSAKRSKEWNRNLKPENDDHNTADDSKEFNEDKYMEHKRKRMKYIKS